MNRFSSYLKSQKLAKQLLLEAEIMKAKGDVSKALSYTLSAVREFMTATNCLASLAFEPRKKYAKKIRPKDLKVL